MTTEFEDGLAEFGLAISDEGLCCDAKDVTINRLSGQLNALSADMVILKQERDKARQLYLDEHNRLLLAEGQMHRARKVAFMLIAFMTADQRHRHKEVVDEAKGWAND